MQRYKVHMRSKPGMYEQYNGFVPVYADNEDEAIEAAHRNLRRNAFPDRGPSMWIVEKVERLYNN
jgi:1,2-phenylacetyl-CoA epoxidase PaaB subunit